MAFAPETLPSLLVPLSHDARDSMDDAFGSQRGGIRAVKISPLLTVTALLQAAVVVLLSESVAPVATELAAFVRSC